MLPEGNGNCFYIEKKRKQKETIIFFHIENGKTQGNAFIEDSEKVLRKNAPVCLVSYYFTYLLEPRKPTSELNNDIEFVYTFEQSLSS